MENLNLFYQDIGPSSSTRRHLTQEEVAKEELAIMISQRYALLEEERSKDKVELDGNTMKEDEEAVKRIKGEALKEKDDPGAFIFPIRSLKVNENALADTGLQEHTTEKPDRHDPNAQDNMKQWKNCCFHKFTTSFCYGKDVIEMQSLEIDDMLRIRVRKDASEEEVFTLVAWIRAFNINEPIYAELCHEFYSTYEFDEMCADDELQSKKIIKFRLGGRAHSLTLLEFARRLGLYQAVELEEDGFNVYFEGGLRNDDNFNAQDYWLSISREENLSLTTGYDKVQKNDLWLLSMFDARHQNGYANVAWVIARWMKRKGAGTQKESQICCGQFISKLARKCRVLTEDVVRSLSAPIYCRDLDTITLRDLIDSDGKLIPEDPQPGVPRVGIPRPPRASMQDLYDRMGHMEIRQDAIERMEYRQSYHWDRYHGVFEHMAGVYSVPLQGAYNPPGYAQPQYDQYYQQYPPPPPQQQQDDDE
ncbi:hypothetical protein Tco_1109699 [Tanacetum coccineum]|uniref:Uncharacterized protein n=1 Tax=Tanacetum coccineum TaxID=301880 RepID=A0ABQ5IHV8_9ASTR